MSAAVRFSWCDPERGINDITITFENLPTITPHQHAQVLRCFQGLMAAFTDSGPSEVVGSSAALLILRESPESWFTVPDVVVALEVRGLQPRSSNVSNAVRTALERLIEAGTVEKTVDKSPVAYRAIVESAS